MNSKISKNFDDDPIDQVDQIIYRVPAWQGRQDIQYERIAGLTNENYRITVDGECFVLRISGQNTGRLGIDRTCELEALQMAAAAGIGPEVVEFLLPEGHLVTSWMDGHHWEVDEFRTPRNVRMLTETIKCIHALQPKGTTFSPFQRVTAFLDVAQNFEVPLPLNFEGFLHTMNIVLADQKKDPSNWLRFCHNDLVCVNYLFIEQEQSIKVLDWEFSGWGDLYYDLATVVYTHDSEGPIPPDLENVMLDSYFGETTTWQRRRLLGMKFMLMLFTGTWGLAQHGMQQAGLIPAVEGFDYLELAQYLFGHDIKELQAQLLHPD